jgi:inner membrane protein
MPSLFGHALAGVAIHSLALPGKQKSRRTIALSLVCALIPDLDWFMSFFPISTRHFLNHRGVTHSLVAAVLIAIGAVILGFSRKERSKPIWICMLACAFSHCLLDACTLGGVGVALFTPVTAVRFVCDFQPIRVGPIPLNWHLFQPFLAGLWTELLWIGLPSVVMLAAARGYHGLPALRLQERLKASLPKSFEGEC